ncbi:MAG: M23 family metallopeptidase [Candidatus Margulisbacteria bacterium]|jgi:murein DD-endopeptidase MepM/ murein hydrolase activator NlpD|nr:M23 family metallopeptidase [Candidatus Margulisiibacteriota bacterium]
MLKNILRVLCLFSLACAATLNITPPDPLQGNSVKVVLATNAVVQDAKALFNKATVPLYLHSPNKYLAILGTAYNWPAGQYPLTVTYRQNGQTFTKNALVALRAGKFEIDTLVITDGKRAEGATDFAALNEENKILGAVFRAWKKGTYIDGIFAHPLGKTEAAVTSPYGAQRRYKDQSGKQISEWAHSGVDYAAPKGTPVHAAQNGVIAVAQKMRVHGGTIVIDHGQGIMSIYNHLDKLLVQKNQYVTKNALIAYSGDSGLATGPHLHYGLSVHDTRVNPGEWFIRKWF